MELNRAISANEKEEMCASGHTNEQGLESPNQVFLKASNILEIYSFINVGTVVANKELK